MSELASENVRRTLPIKYLVGIIILITMSGVGFCIYYFAYWQASPRYALWQMVRAIQRNDTKTLFKYIDLQAVADNLVEKSAGDVDSLLQKKGLGPTKEEDDVSRLVRSLTKKFAKFIAPKVLVSMEPQIRTGVEKYLCELNTMEKAALSTIPAKAQIQENDGIAAVTIVDPINGRTYHFRMARSEETSTWRIVEINYDDFRNFIEKKIID
jgi:Protein of unknown function (DUF2939)